MARRIWLIFAQATTLALAALFVVLTFKPHWVAHLGTGSVTSSPDALGLKDGGAPIASHGFRDAAARAMPDARCGLRQTARDDSQASRARTSRRLLQPQPKAPGRVRPGRVRLALASPRLPASAESGSPFERS